MRAKAGAEPLELPRFRPGDGRRPTLVDVTRDRPFEAWSLPQMEAVIGSLLAHDPPRLEIATLLHDEVRARRPQGSLRVDERFAHYGLLPIPWLADARWAVRTTFPPDLIAAQMTGRRGAHVYVVLRGGYTAASGHYGAYVGSTKRTPERRFLEHRMGDRAGRGLPRHGIELLWSLFAPLNPVPTRKEARLEWETRLHEALAPVVPKVTGDVAF